ncbi:MAG TPA: hypothetical protein VGI64_05605 [Streptosporangiaceae bacterium]
MRGMRITVDAAMRARDVSRPRPGDEQAAERAAAGDEQGEAQPRRGVRAPHPAEDRARQGRDRDQEAAETSSGPPRPATSQHRRRTRRSGPAS